ncbi:MAG: hypothetical protein WD077_01550 [Bacteroidia bacterium]
MRTLIILGLILCMAGTLAGQTQADTVKKRIIYLNAGIDFKVAGISAQVNREFSGEYLIGSSPPEWEWRERSFSKSDFMDNYKVKMYGFHISLSPIKAVTAGLSYRGVLLKKQWDVPAGFFMITGTLAYNHYFKSAPGLFITLGGAGGSFQGTDAGTGREMYFSARPGIGYRIADRFTFMANYNHDWMLYRYHPEPYYYDKRQMDNATWQFSYVSLTLEYHFHLIPD